MRTKALVLTAALVAVGALSSMAQSNVYSLNVVGYVNVPLNLGYNLVTAQLVGTNSNIATVMGNNLPENITVYKWNPALQTLNNPDTYYSAATAGTAGWYDVNGNISTTTLNLGEGFLVGNQIAVTNVTFIGNVSQTTNTTTLGLGYNFTGLAVPLSVDLTTNSTLALPPVNNLAVYTLNSAGNGYNDPITYFDLTIAPVAGWYDVNGNITPIIPRIGQGLLIGNQTAVTPWKTSFTVQ